MTHKRIIAFVLFLLLAGLLLTPAAAEAPAEENGEGSPYAADLPAEENVGEAKGAAETATPQKEEQERGVSAILLDFLSRHSAEIFCILTFLSTCTVTVLFRRGLLPALARALASLSAGIGDGVGELDRAGKRLSEATGGQIAAFADEASRALARLDETAKGLSDLSGRLEALEAELSGAGDERAKTMLILRAQMEMFYRFFSAVNLPQYEKERLGDTYLRLTRLVGDREGQTDEP